MCEASLGEGPLLRLIWDYFRRAGHVECLLALENCCKGYGQCYPGHKATLPPELFALREMSLTGRWDQVIKYLSAFSDNADKKGLQRCMYVAQRQKYLEILEHVEDNVRSMFRLGFGVLASGGMLSPSEAKRTVKLIECQLAILKPLCPSPVEYQSLRDLPNLPSTSSSKQFFKEFSLWQLHSGRLETFYEIGEWISNVLHLNIKFQLPRRDTADRKNSPALLRLVAKGLLYEQCEWLLKTKNAMSEKQPFSSPNILNLGDWIQQLPDNSFQLPPKEICLVVEPLRMSSSSKSWVSQSFNSDEEGHLKDDSKADMSRSVSVLPHQCLSDGEIEKNIATEQADAWKVGHVKHANGVDVRCVSGAEDRNGIRGTDMGDVPSEEEVRSPMTGVKSFLELLREEGYASDILCNSSLNHVLQQTSMNGVERKSRDAVFSSSGQGSKETSSEVLLKPTTCDSGAGTEQQDDSSTPSQLSTPNSNHRMLHTASEVSRFTCNTDSLTGTTDSLLCNIDRDPSTSRDCWASRASLMTSPPSSLVLTATSAAPGPTDITNASSNTISSSTIKSEAFTIPICVPSTHMPISSYLSAHIATNSQGFPCRSSTTVNKLANTTASAHRSSYDSIATTLNLNQNARLSAVPSSVYQSISLPELPPVVQEGGGCREKNRTQLTSMELRWPSIALQGTISDSQVCVQVQMISYYSLNAYKCLLVCLIECLCWKIDN